MEVILAYILASLYAGACVLIGSYCSSRSLTRGVFRAVNVVMFVFAALCCAMVFTECLPQTIVGWIGFVAYCLIMFALYLVVWSATACRIIEEDIAYDFKPKGAFNNDDGSWTYVGYVDNGIATTPVILYNCKDDLHVVSIKVQYFGNLREEPFRVKLYDKERKRHFVEDFKIEVQKVEE